MAFARTGQSQNPLVLPLTGGQTAGVVLPDAPGGATISSLAIPELRPAPRAEITRERPLQITQGSQVIETVNTSNTVLKTLSHMLASPETTKELAASLSRSVDSPPHQGMNGFGILNRLSANLREVARLVNSGEYRNDGDSLSRHTETLRADTTWVANHIGVRPA